MKPEDIAQLAEEQSRRFQDQADEDKRAKQAVLQTGKVDATQLAKGTKPIGAGHDPLVYKQKFWFLSSLPFLRVNAPRPELSSHAEMLESALEGIMLLSQGDSDVWRQMVARADWSGRGWSKVYHWPAAWGDDSFRQKEGESTQDYLERVGMLQSQNFPIVWRLVESENTWPTLDARGNLDQIVELRKMTARAVRKEYGLEVNMGDKELVKVTEYADDVETQTVVMDSSAGKMTPRTAKQWDHGMGMTPYVKIELEPTPPENEQGLHWTGSSFDGRHARPVIDSIMTDALYNFRRAVRAPDEFYLSKEDSEGATPEAAAQGRGVTIKPDGQMFFWEGERHERPTPAETNPDGWKILELLVGFSRDLDIRDVLLGALKGDETGILYNTASQLAQRQFDPTVENFKRGGKRLGQLFFQAVKAFAGEFEGIKDAPTSIPIAFISNNGVSYSLSLSPKDVEGWGARLQTRLELALPVSENGQLTVARLATSPDNPLMPVEDVQSRYLGIENTQDVAQKIIRDQVRRALVPKFVDIVAEQGLQLFNAPKRDLGDLAQTIASFSTAEQQALMGLVQAQSPNGMPPEARNLARGQGNINRTGLPQQPTGARGNEAQSF